MGVGDEGAGAGGGTCATGGSTQPTHEGLLFGLKASAAGAAGSMLDALTSQHDKAGSCCSLHSSLKHRSKMPKHH
jgi:hypothetical protein